MQALAELSVLAVLQLLQVRAGGRRLEGRAQQRLGVRLEVVGAGHRRQHVQRVHAVARPRDVVERPRAELLPGGGGVHRHDQVPRRLVLLYVLVLSILHAYHST